MTDTRENALSEAQFALAGAVAHLETVTQLLADWNDGGEIMRGAPGGETWTSEQFAKANRWDAVYQTSEEVRRRVENLTADLSGLES